MPGQQLSSDYARWWASSNRALPFRIPCFDKVSYEPYVMLRTSPNDSVEHFPPFDERYTGYGKNKVSPAPRGAESRTTVVPRPVEHILSIALPPPCTAVPCTVEQPGWCAHDHRCNGRKLSVRVALLSGSCRVDS